MDIAKKGEVLIWPDDEEKKAPCEYIYHILSGVDPCSQNDGARYPPVSSLAGRGVAFCALDDMESDQGEAKQDRDARESDFHGLQARAMTATVVAKPPPPSV